MTMKALIVIILTHMLLNVKLFGCEERINCIIFIDGKLPEGSWIYDAAFKFTRNDGSLLQVNFDYIIGELIIDTADLRIIKSLNSNDVIEVVFTWKRFDGSYIIYRGEIEQHNLFYDYLIIRVTNLCKRKGKYYFGYSTPFSTSGFLKNKEYNIFMLYDD